MSEQVNPSDVVDEQMIEQPEPEPEPDSGGLPSGRGILDMLMETEAPPNVNPSSIEMDYELSKGKALFLFGLVKAAGTGGMPAIGDMSLGVFLEMREQTGDRADEQDGVEIETLDVDEEMGTDQAQEGQE